MTFNGDARQVSDYIDSNVAIKWNGVNGSVTGDIKYVDNNSLFGEGENTGNYFPFKLGDAYSGKPITVKRTSGTKSEKTVSDTEWILRLTDGTETKYQISSGDTIIANLNFAGATLAEV